MRRLIVALAAVAASGLVPAVSYGRCNDLDYETKKALADKAERIADQLTTSDDIDEIAKFRAELEVIGAKCVDIIAKPQILGKILASSKFRVRLHGVLLMQSLQQTVNREAGGKRALNKALYAYVSQSLDDSNEAVLYRVTKVIELVSTVNDADVDKVVKLVQTGSDPLKRTAAKALAEIGDKRAVSALAVQLAREDDQGVALVLSFALHKLTGLEDPLGRARNENDFAVGKLSWLKVAVSGSVVPKLPVAEANGILRRQLKADQPLAVWAGILSELARINGKPEWVVRNPNDDKEVEKIRAECLKALGP